MEKNKSDPAEVSAQLLIMFGTLRSEMKAQTELLKELRDTLNRATHIKTIQLCKEGKLDADTCKAFLN